MEAAFASSLAFTAASCCAAASASVLQRRNSHRRLEDPGHLIFTFLEVRVRRAIWLGPLPRATQPLISVLVGIGQQLLRIRISALRQHAVEVGQQRKSPHVARIQGVTSLVAVSMVFFVFPDCWYAPIRISSACVFMTLLGYCVKNASSPLICAFTSFC